MYVYDCRNIKTFAPWEQPRFESARTLALATGRKRRRRQAGRRLGVHFFLCLAFFRTFLSLGLLAGQLPPLPPYLPCWCWCMRLACSSSSAQRRLRLTGRRGRRRARARTRTTGAHTRGLKPTEKKNEKEKTKEGDNKNNNNNRKARHAMSSSPGPQSDRLNCSFVYDHWYQCLSTSSHVGQNGHGQASLVNVILPPLWAVIATTITIVLAILSTRWILTNTVKRTVNVIWR